MFLCTCVYFTEASQVPRCLYIYGSYKMTTTTRMRYYKAQFKDHLLNACLDLKLIYFQKKEGIIVVTKSYKRVRSRCQMWSYFLVEKEPNHRNILGGLHWVLKICIMIYHIGIMNILLFIECFQLLSGIKSENKNKKSSI